MRCNAEQAVKVQGPLPILALPTSAKVGLSFLLDLGLEGWSSHQLIPCSSSYTRPHRVGAATWLQATAFPWWSAVTSGFAVKHLLHFQLNFPCLSVSLFQDCCPRHGDTLGVPWGFFADLHELCPVTGGCGAASPCPWSPSCSFPQQLQRWLGESSVPAAIIPAARQPHESTWHFFGQCPRSLGIH